MDGYVEARIRAVFGSGSVFEVDRVLGAHGFVKLSMEERVKEVPFVMAAGSDEDSWDPRFDDDDAYEANEVPATVQQCLFGSRG